MLPKAMSSVEATVRKLCLVFVAVLATVALAQQSSSSKPIKVAGCVMSINGEFRLLAQGQTYTLKGDHDTLFSYSGMQVEVTGTVDSAKSDRGVPVVLHVTKLKKLADSCG